MPNKIQKIRSRKFQNQRGRCFYCGQMMWTESVADFQTEHSISAQKARWFQCTAEHLKAASEGGATSESNIVAACRFCNAHRHRRKRPLTPDAYKEEVRSSLQRGKWFSLKL